MHSAHNSHKSLKRTAVMFAVPATDKNDHNTRQTYSEGRQQPAQDISDGTIREPTSSKCHYDAAQAHTIGRCQAASGCVVLCCSQRGRTNSVQHSPQRYGHTHFMQKDFSRLCLCTATGSPNRSSNYFYLIFFCLLQEYKGKQLNDALFAQLKEKI